jgi:hypothetical protein
LLQVQQAMFHYPSLNDESTLLSKLVQSRSYNLTIFKVVLLRFTDYAANLISMLLLARHFIC